MITLKVKDDDWLAAKDHWVALKAQLTDKASIAKADFIDDVIFNTTSTTLTTATTITTEIDLPSVSVMTELINEIDNETKMDESNTNMNQLESSEEIKLDENVKKFVCDAFEKASNGAAEDLDRKLDIFKQFCQACKFGKEKAVWNCDELEISSFKEKEIRDLYSSRWNDFVSIRCDLFDNKLRQLFEKELNVSKKEVDQLYGYFTHYRTLCGVLPIISDGFRLSPVESSDKLVKIHEEFLHNKTTSSTLVGDISGCLDLSDIYRFMVIWNGVYVLLNKPIRYDRQGPFDGQALEVRITEGDIFTDSADDTSTHDRTLKETKNRLCELVCDYITNEFAETNIFGYYVNKTGFERAIFGWTNKNLEIIQMAENEEILNYCKQMVFDNTFDELKKLIGYCISNISDIDSYKHNINYQKDGEKCCYDSGIACFIANQLAYVVFHDVTIDSLNNKNNNENRKLLFPQLLKASKFMYNTSCFLYCYPYDPATKESYYLAQYFDLKNALFDDIFGKEKILSETASKFCEYNYCRYQCRGDGTILHKACSLKQRRYCNILIKDGFDVNKPNRLNDRWRATPMDIAKAYSSTLMTHLFGVCLLFRSLFFFFFCLIVCSLVTSLFSRKNEGE